MFSNNLNEEEGAEYMDEVLNVEDAREANTKFVGYWRIPAYGELNERPISIEEVWKAVNEMKSGKALGLVGFPVECLKVVCQCENG